MKNWHKRGAVIAAGLLALGTASALVLNALNSNIALYVTPSEVAAGKAPEGRAFRIGGMVKQGSLRRDDLTVHFVITDLAREVPVAYTGLLPDLFKEGKGAVVQGRLEAGGGFTASEVLAKHDENYMPPPAQHALDEARKHQGGGSLK
ncbi:cytochrome c maturation protein CcmE [Ramlibacter sp.]|uniref:cytochrome c maturation protein CcmE n=1 Tax=Ramlibacter sp. TaxID=1917967 RepID=UPI002627DBF4|nr:cytochrome c maturation protein CcmE [Ramlibacter sp.]MDB5953689.1 CcmE/CycJ protein [Ramlibacter sp.]